MKSTQIELTNLEILESVNGFNALRGREMETDIGYRVALNAKRIRAAAEEYQEFRTELMKKHAELDERGEFQINQETKEVIFLNAGARKVANDGIRTLNKTTVTLDLYQFPLGLFKNMKLPSGILEDLYWMVRPDKEEPAKE